MRVFACLAMGKSIPDDARRFVALTVPPIRRAFYGFLTLFAGVFLASTVVGSLFAQAPGWRFVLFILAGCGVLGCTVFIREYWERQLMFGLWAANECKTRSLDELRIAVTPYGQAQWVGYELVYTANRQSVRKEWTAKRVVVAGKGST